jgi:hypothetical protein
MARRRPRLHARGMSSRNGSSRDEHDSFTAQVAAAERFAKAMVVAFAVCEEIRAPLTDIQKIAIIEAALLEFDGLESQLGSLAGISELLRSLR